MSVRLGTRQKARDVRVLATNVAEAILQAYLLGPTGISNALSALFRSLEATRGSDTVETRATVLVDESISYAIVFLLGSDPKPANIGKAEIVEFTTETLNKVHTICDQQKIVLTTEALSSPASFSPFKIAAEDTAYYFGRRGLSGSHGNNLAKFFAYVADAILRSTSKKPNYFRPLLDVLGGPAARASDLASAWATYRSILIKRFEDQVVFGDDP